MVFRWGILSTGWIAEQFVNDLRLVPDGEPLAVGSRTPAAARAFADRFGIPRAHGSWPALVDDPEVDAIYVATPHHAHFEASMLSLAAGKATLTEKPVTLAGADTKGCDAKIIVPDPDTAADTKALTESFFTQLGPNSNFGSQFAQTVTVKCKDSHL